MTTSDEEIATVLNSHFVNVFTIEDTENLPEFTVTKTFEPLNNINVTEENISKILKEINPAKSMGPDNIHPRVLKECRNTIIAPLCKIFNKSLENGKLPTQWKKSKCHSNT